MVTIESTDVKDIGGLQEAAEKVKRGFGFTPWFRGQVCDPEYFLSPRVHRHYSREQEINMLLNFKLNAPALRSAVPSNEDHVGWLTLMQHYGLPTRLLDWSESLLVAAYFAVKSYFRAIKNSKDPGGCEIWCLSPHLLHANQDREPLIEPYGTGVHYNIASDAFLRTDSNEIDYVAPFLPRRDDVRLVTQHAAFTIHGSKVPLEEHASADKFLHRLVIDADHVGAISRALDYFGIQERSLFPDLDHLSSWLAENVSQQR